MSADDKADGFANLKNDGREAQCDDHIFVIGQTQSFAEDCANRVAHPEVVLDAMLSALVNMLAVNGARSEDIVSRVRDVYQITAASMMSKSLGNITPGAEANAPPRPIGATVRWALADPALEPDEIVWSEGTPDECNAWASALAPGTRLFLRTGASPREALAYKRRDTPRDV